MNDELKSTIVITMEIYEREFIPKVLLSKKLAEEGFRVFIGSMESAHVLLTKSIDPCLILHKSPIHKKVRHYKSKGHQFICLDEEGGPTTSRSLLPAWCGVRYREIDSQTHDVILFAEERYRKQVKAMNNSRGIRMATTGWPRIDVWRKYKWLFEEKAIGLREEHGNFILFPTSFGPIPIKRFSNDKDPERLTRVRSDLKEEYLRLYLKMIAEVAPKLKDKIIVVRPHPSESVSRWYKLLRDVPNVKIIRDGDIGAWITASIGLIQWRSTSTIQAALFGKQSLTYRVPITEGLTDTPSFELCKNVWEIDEMLESVNELESPNPKLVDRAEKYLVLESGSADELAIDRIANELKKVKTTGIRSPVVSVPAKIWIEYVFVGSKIKKHLKKLGIYDTKVNVVAEKLPYGIRSTEIESYIEKFYAMEKSLYRLKVRQEASNLVSIENHEESHV